MKKQNAKKWIKANSKTQSSLVYNLIIIISFQTMGKQGRSTKDGAPRPAKKRRPDAHRNNGNANNDNLPIAMKSAKFNSTDDDNYCNILCTVIGPEKKQHEAFVLLLALGLGVQLRGYDMIDFALPMEQHHIQDLNQQMQENNWTLLAFNITSGQKQNE